MLPCHAEMSKPYALPPGRLGIMTQFTPPTPIPAVVLAPRLVVGDAAAAIDFYVHALGAQEVTRYVHEGRIVHAALSLGDAGFTLKDADETDPAPEHYGGTPVILGLEVEDVDALAERMVAHGARVVFPIEDRPDEGRGGRLTDPFGHVWMVHQRSP